MATVISILALFTVVAAAVWIFSRRRDAVKPSTLSQRDAVLRHRRSRVLDAAPVIQQQDVDSSPSWGLSDASESHTHHHAAPSCVEAPLSGHDSHFSGGGSDHGCFTDGSGGGGFDGGGFDGGGHHD